MWLTKYFGCRFAYIFLSFSLSLSLLIFLLFMRSAQQCLSLFYNQGSGKLTADKSYGYFNSFLIVLCSDHFESHLVFFRFIRKGLDLHHFADYLVSFIFPFVGYLDLCCTLYSIFSRRKKCKCCNWLHAGRFGKPDNEVDNRP